MKVAAIIVNYNDAEETAEYVKKLREYETIQRIVVVDNVSTASNTMPILRQVENEKVVVLQSDKNGGYSYGNNFGVAYLEEQKEQYDVLIISNPDIEIEESAIKRCLDVLKNNEKVAMVAPRMYDAKNSPIRRSSWKMRTFWLDVIHATRFLELVFYRKFRKGEYSEEEYAKELLQVEAISGAFFMVKYDVFKEIGMFDENVFLFYEEDILAKKLSQKGYETVSINDVKFVHYESQTIDKTLRYYKKMKQLYQSKMYYHKQYNQIGFWQVKLFQLLNIFRKIELLLEIPIRKLWKK